MSPNTARERVSRHRPVSCHFCRSRKLRCSRQFPCANCTTRGLDCQLYSAQAASARESTSLRNRDEALVDANGQILSRLKKLEEILLRSKDPQVISELADLGKSSLPESQLPERQAKKRDINDAEWLERECMDQSSSVSNNVSIPQQPEEVLTDMPRNFSPIQRASCLGFAPFNKQLDFYQASMRTQLATPILESPLFASGFPNTSRPWHYYRSILMMCHVLYMSVTDLP